MSKENNIKNIKRTAAFIVLAIALFVLFIASVNLGSIKMDMNTIVEGIFRKGNEKFDTVYDLRFPRIIVALLAGAGMAVSGTLFQAVLKNPLADPGLIGVSSASAFVAIFITAFFPLYYNYVPIMSFAAGIFAFALVYSLSWKRGLSPLRILLVGIAVQAVFTGLSSSLNAMSGASQSSAAAIVNSNISMKTWKDVNLLLIYLTPGLILSIFFSGSCNILAFQDKTIRGLGINANKLRFYISLIAVLLASSVSAVVGVISFIGLLVPHIGRLIVGNTHKALIPFSMMLGAFIFLLADTVGRMIVYPYEISPSIIMSLIGGPVFIILLRRSESLNAK